MTEREPHEFDERDPGAGAGPTQDPEPRTEGELDVEAPNESGPGHNPAPDGPAGAGEPTDPDGGATRP